MDDFKINHLKRNSNEFDKDDYENPSNKEDVDINKV